MFYDPAYGEPCFRIYLRAGVYELASTLVLDHRDLAAEPSPLELYFKDSRQVLACYPNVEGNVEGGYYEHLWVKADQGTAATAYYYYSSRPSDNWPAFPR